MTALEIAMSALPDSDTAGPDGTGYKYAWDEVTPAEQEWVKDIRRRVRMASDPEDLRWTLDNIYTIARRETARDGGDPRGRWAHVLRICEKAGCQSRGVLRDNGGLLPDSGSRLPEGDTKP